MQECRRFALTVLLCIAMSVPAVRSDAQPATTSAGLMARYLDLVHSAEQLNEKLLRANEQQALDQRQLTTLTERVRRAEASADTEERAVADQQASADALVTKLFASPRHARFTELSPLGNGVLDAVAAQLTEAHAARRTARAAAATADAFAADMASRAAELQRERARLEASITEVMTTLNALSPGERALLAQPIQPGMYQVPPVTDTGQIGTVLRYALAQVGKPYLWGGTGPNEFDCSGLTQMAYRAAGLAIPRVSQDQAHVGVAVARENVRAGDLIIYYSTAQHVAMALDNAIAVHASHPGRPIGMDRIDAIGPVLTIRRIVA